MKDTKNSNVTLKQCVNCDSCDKSFANPQNLKIHKASVHEKLRFKCDSCNIFTSPSASTLRNHIKKAHKGVNFNCNLCGKYFANSQNLKKHRRTVHEKKRVDCDSCDRSFSQPHGLKIHKRNVHKNIQALAEQSNENLTMDEVKHEETEHNESTQIELNKIDINQDQSDDSEIAKIESLLR